MRGIAIFALLAVCAAVSLALAQEPPAEGSGNLPPVEVREGLVVNFAHRFYFPAGAWTLANGEADFLELNNAHREGVTMRVLVAESQATLEDAVKALREQASAEANLHVLSEQARRLGGREAADLLVVRNPIQSAPPVVLRTVCFVREGRRFYFRLEAPADVYEKASRDFEDALAGLKFEFRFPWKK